MNGVKIGKNIVLCNGNFVCGIKQELVYLLFVIIYNFLILTSWSIFIFPYFQNTNLLFLCVTVFILFFLSLLFFISSFATDPGIIPRQMSCEDVSELDYEEYKNMMAHDLNIENKPRIYTERFCNTCKIKRGPKVSHCHLCDNCVKNYDHHCNFIANCVGERNHKYFYLFLLFHNLFLISIISCSLLHFIFILYNTDNGLLEKFINLPYCFYSCIGLIVLSLILFMMKLLNIFVTYFFSLIGTISFFFLFIYCIGKGLDHKINPVSLIVIYMSIPCFLFILPILCRQTKLIMYGLTVKQYDSIMIYKKSFDKNKTTQAAPLNSYPDYINQIEEITLKEKFKNLIKFCIKPVPESLLIGRA